MKKFIVCMLFLFLGIGPSRADDVDPMAYQVNLVKATSEEVNGRRTNYRAYDAQGRLRLFLAQTEMLEALGRRLYVYYIYNQKGEVVYRPQLAEVSSLNFAGISHVLENVENGCTATILVLNEVHRLLWVQGNCSQSSSSK
jgi:hypothetical protein